MPNRARAIDRMVAYEMPGLSWDIHGVNPRSGWSDEQYEETKAHMGALYDEAMKAVDWHRVLLEAGGRCASLSHEHSFEESWDTRVCGDSLRSAMMIMDRIARWEDLEGVDVIE